jgi:hypothetical protein
LKSAGSRNRTGATFSELVNLFVAAKYGSVAETTSLTWDYKFKSVINPLIGHVPAAALDFSSLDFFVLKRLESVKRVTVCRELADIQTSLNWAVSRKYPLKNPVAGYHKPQRDDAIIQPPTPNEVKRIWNSTSPISAAPFSWRIIPRPDRACRNSTD